MYCIIPLVPVKDRVGVLLLLIVILVFHRSLCLGTWCLFFSTFFFFFHVSVALTLRRFNFAQKCKRFSALVLSMTKGGVKLKLNKIFGKLSTTCFQQRPCSASENFSLSKAKRFTVSTRRPRFYRDVYVNVLNLALCILILVTAFTRRRSTASTRTPCYRSTTRARCDLPSHEPATRRR